MKFIYCHMEQTGGSDILQAFTQNGHEIQLFDTVIPTTMNSEESEQLERRLSLFVQELKADGIFSWNFIPIVSTVCENQSIPYLSWVFDSPLPHLYTKEVQNPCNFIFVFDRTYTKELIASGVRAIYLPLGVNTERLNEMVITDAEIGRYGVDIAFVGSLYQNNMMDIMKLQVPSYLADKINDIFARQLGNWEENLIYSEINQMDCNILGALAGFQNMDRYPLADQEELVKGILLSKKYANLERSVLLNHIGEAFPLTIYNSMEQLDMLTNVEKRPGVAYENEAPKVFFSSKINLNLTLKSIRSGIPLRAFDVMGSGGFLISNEQEEFYECFEPGKDLVCFRTAEELFDQLDYYLANDTQRMQIAMNGLEAVNARHSLVHRVATMIGFLKGTHA